jgi:hypothetical protein
MAKNVRGNPIIGVAAYKPANSHPETEPRVFDFVGMLGIPLVPCHEFPAKAPAAFFSIHALKDPNLVPKLDSYVQSGKPVLVTDGLARALINSVNLTRSNVHILPVKSQPKSLLDLAQADLDSLRGPLLKPLKCTFKAPNRVALYLFKDKNWVIENFNDDPVTVEFNGKPLVVPGRQWRYSWK